MRRLLLLCFGALLAFTSNDLQAQERTITGKVTSIEDGSSLPGVNILLKGTTNGTVTDSEGRYTLAIPGSEGVLVFTFIGFKTKEVDASNGSTIDVQLETDVTQLSEVVVTALGLERDKRSLGYALQSVSGGAISQRSEPNVLNSLQGKVAGVNIVGSSGAPGANTNINIRGITSFSGSNQPLIVVDGVIFSNDVNQSQNTLFGSQPSNRLADIAPENIESINVLKGPAAAVLYGSRASAGAIVITTKSGKNMAGKTEVTFLSSVNFQNVFGLPDFQNDYGQGVNNDFNNTSTNSWGPRFGSGLTEVVTLQGETVPYQAYPDNIKDFYRTGRIIQNSLNLASGDAENNIAASVSSTFQEGIIPFTEFNRNSVQFGGNTKLKNGIRLGGSATYVKTQQVGIPQGNGGSAFGQLSRIPRSFDLVGRPYKNALNRSIYYSATQNHPLWSTEFEQLNGEVDRIFGHFTLGYQIKEWLNVSYRVTGDTYSDRRKLSLAIGAARAPQGQVVIDNFYRSELNGDLIITADKDNFLLDGLDANVLLGQNINQRKFQNSFVSSESLTIPDFYNPSNGSVFTNSGENSNIRRLMGYYGQVNLAYNNYLFLELTGRVDKSSTLPDGSNSYFYPSVAVSFVPTDAFALDSEILSYAKIRASAAKVGRDADPYLLNSVFVKTGYGNNLASITFPLAVGGGSIPGFQPGSRIGSSALTPEFVTSYEGGINVGLFENKIGLDVGYFYSESENQIFNVAVSNSSGFDTRTTNVGLMTNRGWEVVLTATPVKGDFTWDVSLNFTRIRNKVHEIAPGVENTTIIGNSFIGIAPSIAKGHPYGVIIGTKNARNEDGELLINPATGLFVPGIAGEVIANPNPDWLGGITNTFSYKGLSLSVLFDARYGGELYSFGMVDLRSGGHLEITGVDREQPRILPGVIDNGDGTFRPNNIQVSAQTFWAGLGGLASEGAVFEATVYRLREMALNYTLPAKWFANSPFGSVSLGVSGRNLWFFAPGFPGDPELNTQGAGNIQGMDLNGAPNTRNFGANLRVTF